MDQKNEEVAAKGTLNEDRILCEIVCDSGILGDFGDDNRAVVVVVVTKRCLFCVCVCVSICGLDQRNEEVAATGTLNEDRILCEIVCEVVGFFWDDDRAS